MMQVSKLPNKDNTQVVIPKHQYDRIKDGDHKIPGRFRGQFAGCFNTRKGPIDVLLEHMELLQDFLETIAKDQVTKSQSFTAYADIFIGWRDTIPTDMVFGFDKEPLINTNKFDEVIWKAERLIVQPGLTAPGTNALTIAAQFVEENRSVSIETMYPGVETGNLSKEVTNLVFFDHNTPGEPID